MANKHTYTPDRPTVQEIKDRIEAAEAVDRKGEK